MLYNIQYIDNDTLDRVETNIFADSLEDAKNLVAQDALENDRPNISFIE